MLCSIINRCYNARLHINKSVQLFETVDVKTPTISAYELCDICFTARSYNSIESIYLSTILSIYYVQYEFQNILPLQYCVLTHRADQLQILLQHCNIGSIDRRNRYGKTALYSACEFGRTDMVQRLLFHGASINLSNHNYETPFYIACLKGRIKIVQYMLECYSDQLLSNELYRQSGTPIHASMIVGSIELLDILLAYGFNINATDKYNRTALHIAAYRGYYDGADALIQRGIVIDSKSKYAVKTSRRSKSNAIMHLLYQAGYKHHKQHITSKSTIALQNQDNSNLSRQPPTVQLAPIKSIEPTVNNSTNCNKYLHPPHRSKQLWQVKQAT